MDTHPFFFGRCYSLGFYPGEKHNSQAFCTHKTDDWGGWGKQMTGAALLNPSN